MKTEPTIQDVLEVEDTPETQVEEETPVVSQKEISEAIDNASQEKEEEIESISESEDITETLLNSEEEIKEPVLKSPTKIEEKTEDLSSPIDGRNLFESKEVNDLDYRKDLAKITNTIKGSRLFLSFTRSTPRGVKNTIWETLPSLFSPLSFRKLAVS